MFIIIIFDWAASFFARRSALTAAEHRIPFSIRPALGAMCFTGQYRQCVDNTGRQV